MSARHRHRPRFIEVRPGAVRLVGDRWFRTSREEIVDDAGHRGVMIVTRAFAERATPYRALRRGRHGRR